MRPWDAVVFLVSLLTLVISGVSWVACVAWGGLGRFKWLAFRWVWGFDMLWVTFGLTGLLGWDLLFSWVFSWVVVWVLGFLWFCGCV